MEEAVRRAAERAQPWTDIMARAGYVARGALFLMVGGLALTAAVGLGGGEATDPTGVLVTIARASAGRAALGVLALGLLAHAAFRAMLVVGGESYIPVARGRMGALRRSFVRISNAAIGFVYVGLAATAAGLAFGRRGWLQTDKDRETRHWSARLLHQPSGRWLLLGVAIVVGIVAIVTAVRAFTPNPNLQRRLRIEEMSIRARHAMAALGRIALLARGIVLFGIAFSLAKAAFYHAPRAAQGPGGALRSVWSLPHGGVWLALVAGGLIAFGVYGLCEARWRRLLGR